MHRLVRRLKQPSSLKHLRCLSSTHLLNPPPCSRRYDYYINNPNNNVFCYCSSYSRTISRSYCYSVGSGDTNKKVGLEKPSSAIGLAFGSVVKIFTFTSVPDYSMPWQSHGQGENIGSGFVITGKRILTNAHVVAHHTFIRVMKHGSSEKYRAEVQAIGHECDLAILVVKCKEFWKGMNSLTLGDIPFLQDAVSVVGYPIEGDNISVTKGVVSRVEPTKYDHGATTLLAIHIDAHINLGNDGAPAVLGDLSVVGVACAEKPNGAGYIIPAPVIKHFIAGVDESGKYAGFCSMGLTCQHTENSQLREHFRMHPNMTGVLVNKINPLSDASKVLKKDDILLSFDGVRIANNGTVPFRNGEGIPFDHLVSMKKPNETASVKVLRDGEELEFSIKLHPLQPLVPVHQFDKHPSYFIFAGFVFIPLTQQYLDHESSSLLYELALRKIAKKSGQQLVIISQVFMDDINADNGEQKTFYDVQQLVAQKQVKKVNGVAVENLKHLCELVKKCDRESIRFDLADERVIVLNYEMAKAATVSILKQHRIPSALSSDLVDQQRAPVELACSS